MTSKPTPGPWEIRTAGSRPAYNRYFIEPSVAEVFYTNATGEANARLIAAAPDLLAALEGLLSLYSYKFATTSEWQCAVTEAKESAITAIAKARGE